MDGTHVAHVDLTLHQEDMCNEQQQEPANISSFISLKVSQDLDVVVIVSSSNSAVALNLNLYFRYVNYCNLKFELNNESHKRLKMYLLAFLY